MCRAQPIKHISGKCFVSDQRWRSCCKQHRKGKPQKKLTLTLALSQVASVDPGAGYYLQLENADAVSDVPQGIIVIGGIGEAEFSFTDAGVRTRPFTITQAQPQVRGGIFSCH